MKQLACIFVAAVIITWALMDPKSLEMVVVALFERLEVVGAALAEMFVNLVRAIRDLLVEELA